MAVSVSASQLIKLIKSVTSLVSTKRKVTAIVCVFYEKRRLKKLITLLAELHVKQHANHAYKYMYNTGIKKSSPYALSVVINQLELLAYLLSHSILIGASSEISIAEKTPLLFSQFWAGFWRIFLKISNQKVSADCLEFND